MKGKRIFLAVVALALVFSFTLVFCRVSEAATSQKPAKNAVKAESTPVAPAAVFSTADAENCSGCHQAYMDSITDPKMLADKHKEAAADCFTCHEKEFLEKKHEGVTQAPGKVFRQRKYTKEMCMNCHEEYEKLAEKTRDSKAFTTSDGNTINPHDVSPLGETHAGKTECFNCHKMHKNRPPIEYCYGCHHPRQLNNCKDCHSKK